MFLHWIGVFAALLMFVATSPAGAADTIYSAHCIGCDMHGRDLRGQDLHGATYIGADMRNVDLRNADLHDAKFIGVDLAGSRFDGSDLRGVSFTGSDFGDATFDNAQVSGVRITGGDLRRARLAGVKAYAFLARCVGCDFARADFHGLDLHGTALIGADFHDANLERVNLNGATLCAGDDRRGGCIELRGARVTGADFRNIQWCRQLDRVCRPVTADELRRYSHNPLDGALVP